MNKLLITQPLLLVMLYAVVVTAIAAVLIFLFRKTWTEKKASRSWAIKLSVSLITTLYSLVFLEGVFATVMVQSDGFGFTLSARRWFHLHWNPINAEGFRDYDHKWANKTCYVVGDSFVAGHGLSSIRSRFSHIIANKLGRDWTVAVLAQNGWNLHDYIKALVKQKKKPDVIIVSYFLNDILGTAGRVKSSIKRPSKPQNPTGMVGAIVNHSYLFNWVYWRLYKTDLGSHNFWDYFRRCYEHEAMWKVHTKELDLFAMFAKKKKAKLCFVVWPNLRDVEGTADMTKRVADYLKSKDVMVIDLAPKFINSKSTDLMINAVDAHPNEDVNRDVGLLLFDTLTPWQ